MNKIVHEKSVVDFDVFFKRCENNTRQNSVRKIENFKYHLDVAQNIFSYRVINYWNKLSYDTSQLTGSMFKATVKKVLKKEAVKFVNFGISFNVVTSWRQLLHYVWNQNKPGVLHWKKEKNKKRIQNERQ